MPLAVNDMCQLEAEPKARSAQDVTRRGRRSVSGSKTKGKAYSVSGRVVGQAVRHPAAQENAPSLLAEGRQSRYAVEKDNQPSRKKPHQCSLSTYLVQYDGTAVPKGHTNDTVTT